MSSSSLHAFLVARRADLLRNWKEWVQKEVTSREMPAVELVDSMPLFIEALIASLAPVPPGEEASARSEVWSASIHGGERLRLGFDVAAVVREYNLLRRAILDLVYTEGFTLTAAESFRVSDGISLAQAAAVAEYQRVRDQEQRRQAAEHLAFLAHELRNPLSNALMAFALMRGTIPTESDKHVALLNRNLRRVTELLDETLVAGRLTTGDVLARAEQVDLTACARQIVEELAPDAEQRNVALTAEIEDGLVIEADGRLLRSLISNLMGNGIKFSKPSSVVSLRIRRSDAIVIVEVEDGCGGLPADKLTAIFDPHVQIGTDRSGFGLGLAIARQAAEAHRGTLQVQNVDSKGCCFRLELPVSRR